MITIKFNKTVYKIPNFFVGGVEDMGTILVDVDTFDILAIDVTAEVGAFVYDEAGLACLTGFVGEGGAEEAGAYNQIVVMGLHEYSKNLKRKSHTESTESTENNYEL